MARKPDRIWPDRFWLAKLGVFAAAFAAALWMWIEVSLEPPPQTQWMVEDDELETAPETIAVSEVTP